MKGLNVSLPNEIDTLIIISKSEKKIILQGGWRNLIIELNKVENGIGEIDAENLANLKNQILLKFQERSKLRKCPDLRSESEKIRDNLIIEIPIEEPIEEIEIPIETLKDTLSK